MTNSEALVFLLDIKDKILSAYPFPHDTVIDHRFAVALGQILAVAHEAIESVSNSRNFKVMDRYQLSAAAASIVPTSNEEKSDGGKDKLG